MPPKKDKSKDNLNNDRLVDVILNLKEIVKEMKDKLDKTHDIIINQQREITRQKQTNIEILKILQLKSTDLNLEKLTATPQYLHSYGTLNISLNDSGPEGLTFIHDTKLDSIQVQNEACTSQPPKEVSTPTRSSTTMPVEKMQLRSRPRRKLQSEAVAGQLLPSPDALPAQPAHQTAVSKPPVPPGPAGPAGPMLPTTQIPSPLPCRIVESLVPAALIPIPQSALLSPKVVSLMERRDGLRAAAPRSVSLHVFNLSEETTSADLVDHIKSTMDIQVDRCEQLTVTRGHYSSFKIDVPANKVGVIRNRKHWPEGVSIRIFNIVKPKNFKVSSGDRLLR